MGDWICDVTEWSKQQFQNCELGDLRRTKRVVELAAQMARCPSGSIPKQTPTWSDCKAAYRLFDRDEATFPALLTPHWQQTRAAAVSHVLLLGDTTEFNFGAKREVEGLAPMGNGRGRGFMLHSSLAIDADTQQALGLAGGEIFYRQAEPKGETRTQRLARPRESEVWGRVIEQVGSSPEGARWTHVFDRGADNFEVYCRLLLQGVDWVIRAAQLDRRVLSPAGDETSLQARAASLPVSGTYELELRGRLGRKARTARLEVRFGQVTALASARRSNWVRACGIVSIVQWVIEVREVDAPRGVEPLHWVLLTSHAITTLDDALRVIGYYERRWLIEEFHKAIKTGCEIETRQLQTAHRLEGLLGLVAVLAVRLLQLKQQSRATPERPAAELVPPQWLEALQAMRPTKNNRPWTIRDFCRQLAKLGGFLGRKCDGEPGWITLWRGFDSLALLVLYQQKREKCG